ncbi:helix-hairpin-helix domain-containing protein [Curtobacterium sp. A7_M15]|uniref:helix-hairpin-helix domain-containing protein n=1 Tax=Curtobacterium sp. A7_M15 TaxID=3065241 RepID=UPI002737E649|nr:helix-hairpin-helix domain-containing protein [Curtobacterium sp. A7_M15]MDP4332908.1 helix-hairpin-helix domain-containing protein [Curtobacterium sp. A7_M15]
MLAALVVVVAVVVVAVGSWTGSSSSSSSSSGGGGDLSVAGGPSAPPSPSSSPSAATLVVVHVVGAVGRPGIVTLPGGSRVSDAVERAGGPRGDADLARLNLARVLVDGERLYVPAVGETDVPEPLDGGAGVAGAAGGGGGSVSGGTGAGGAAGGAGSAGDAVVDLNTADQRLLETLPGIGPSLAGRILAWRDEHGRFTAVEDLLDVSGIGDVRFAELRDRVRV